MVLGLVTAIALGSIAKAVDSYRVAFRVFRRVSVPLGDVRQCRRDASTPKDAKSRSGLDLDNVMSLHNPL